MAAKFRLYQNSHEETCYDSDGEVGPFYDAIAKEGDQEEESEFVACLTSEKEFAVSDESVAQILDFSSNGPPELPEGHLTRAQMLVMKMRELQEELKKRGASVYGKKKELASRLWEVQADPSLFAKTKTKPKRTTATLHENGFPRTAHWLSLIHI